MERPGEPMHGASASLAGVLLVNLGTPEAPTAAAVRPYLREFLSDPRVLDIAAPLRWMLVNAVITPRRAPKSAEAYASVWMERGSPLLVHSRDLATALAQRLAPVPVELAMRYGEPSIAGGLERLRAAGAERVVVAPLYPQYASSSTGTALAEVYRVAAESWNTPFVTALPAFYDAEPFLAAWEAVARPALAAARPDRVLFSFHGLPKRHLEKSDEARGARCLAHDDCCAAITRENRWCYRAQCFATARGLAARLGIAPDDVHVSFQSRLGKGWIEPFTDDVLPAWARAGVERVAVLCPAFVADCLETVEEIGIRAREDFRAAGGEELVLVPSLNAHPAWVDALAALLRPHLAHP